LPSLFLTQQCRRAADFEQVLATHKWSNAMHITGLTLCIRKPLPGAAMAYLRGKWTPAHLFLKRLRACVTAKQNGFWQIVR
jgi:hypothetical protein